MPRVQKSSTKSPVVWALLRISLGFVFLWAFVDKLMGLGFATCRDAKTNAVEVMCHKAWASGGSPTTGFLKFAAKGPFEGFYHSLAGHSWADWLFMAGLLLIGVSLIFGVALKLATMSSALLLFLMWTALLWPENNPVLDEHIIYIFVLWGIYLNRNDTVWSLRSWWQKQSLVKQLPILE